MGMLQLSCALHRFRCPLCRKSSTLRFRQPSPRRSRNSNYFGRKVRSGIARCSSTKFQRSSLLCIVDFPSRFRIPKMCHRSACICLGNCSNMRSTRYQLRTRRSRFLHPPFQFRSYRTSCSWPSPSQFSYSSSTHLRHTSGYLPGRNSPSPSCSYRPDFATALVSRGAPGTRR